MTSYETSTRIRVSGTIDLVRFSQEPGTIIILPLQMTNRWTKGLRNFPRVSQLLTCSARVESYAICLLTLDCTTTHKNLHPRFLWKNQKIWQHIPHGINWPEPRSCIPLKAGHLLLCLPEPPLSLLLGPWGLAPALATAQLNTPEWMTCDRLFHTHLYTAQTKLDMRLLFKQSWSPSGSNS